MTSSFVYVLGAGLAIFMVGGIMAGYVADTGGTGATAGDAVLSEPLGTIGGGTQSSDRYVVENDDFLVQRQSPNATEISGRTVRASNSATGSSSGVVEFETFQPRQGWISFVPTEASSPDNLVLTLNGERLDVPAFEVGNRVVIPVDDALKQGTNTLHVSAKGVGWQVWRSNSYTLQNLQVTVSDTRNEREVIPFRVFDYEVNGFDYGQITYSITEEAVRDQPLKVAVNGNVVSERLPVKRASPYRVRFFANQTGLHAGENTVSFFTAGNSEYPLSSVDVHLFFYAGTQRSTVVRDFNLSKGRYNNLDTDSGGQVTFFVERVLVDRPMTISLTNQSFQVNPTTGTNTVTFGKNAVVAGDNTVRVATDGAYRISSFNITVPK